MKSQGLFKLLWSKIDESLPILTINLTKEGETTC